MNFKVSSDFYNFMVTPLFKKKYDIKRTIFSGIYLTQVENAVITLKI